jgi:hypothetical protein
MTQIKGAMLMTTKKNPLRWEQVKGNWRNCLVATFAIVFLVLAILSWPVEPLELFASPVEATYIFDLQGNVFLRFTNGTAGFYNMTVARGTVTLSGKGGMSAENPLTMRVILNFNKVVKPFSTVFVAPDNAYYYPIVKDAQGFSEFAHINLTTTDGYKWSGESRVVFFIGGALGMSVSADNQVVHSPSEFQIESATVTVSSRTNSLLISLTWAVLFFAVLGLRREKCACQLVGLCSDCLYL